MMSGPGRLNRLEPWTLEVVSKPNNTARRFNEYVEVGRTSSCGPGAGSTCERNIIGGGNDQLVRQVRAD